MRYAPSAPPAYHDADALTVCLAALATVRRTLPNRLALPGAEACLDDTPDLLDALVSKLTSACDLTDAEIARIEAAEAAAEAAQVPA